MGAQDARAEILGDKAPEISVSKWLKGGPINGFDGKHIYVVEFWATWCPHCRKAISHLSALSDKFKDKGVVVMGISREAEKDVADFLAGDQAPKFTYAVAVDDEGKTYEAYMDAFGASGIPHAFVVDKDGIVVWDGHPMGELEQVITQVLDGSFDREAAQKASTANSLSNVYFYMGQRTNETRLLDEVAKKILAYSAAKPKVLEGFARRIIADTALRQPNLQTALDAIRMACKATNGLDAQVLKTYAQVLKKLGKTKEADEMAAKAEELALEGDHQPSDCR